MDGCNPILDIVALFQTQNRMSLLLDIPQSTIADWVVNGHVPSKRIPEVIEKAARLDPPITLTVADFFPKDSSLAPLRVTPGKIRRSGTQEVPADPEQDPQGKLLRAIQFSRRAAVVKAEREWKAIDALVAEFFAATPIVRGLDMAQLAALGGLTAGEQSEFFCALAEKLRQDLVRLAEWHAQLDRAQP